MLVREVLSSFLSKMSWLVGTIKLKRCKEKWHEKFYHYTYISMLKTCSFEFFLGDISLLYTPKQLQVYFPCLPENSLYPRPESQGYIADDICQHVSDESKAGQKPRACSFNQQVLVVDDNQMNQKIAALLLEKAGYKFTVVSNGLEAVNLIKTGRSFGVILMDCNMPIMDGLAATSHIRQWEIQNGLDKTPIIALTGSVEPEEVKSCYDVGMDAYLPKPYRPEQLISLLTKLNISD